jgi:hypothetical protein
VVCDRTNILDKTQAEDEAMKLGTEIFTTGQVAKIAAVAPRTVTVWCDDYDLKNYALPGSRDRRIHRDDLLEFLHHHRMTRAYDILARGKTIITVGISETLAKSVQCAVKDAMFKSYSSLVEMTFDCVSPAGLTLIDASIGVASILQCVAVVRNSWPNVPVAVLANDYSTEADRERLAAASVAVVDVATIAEKLPSLYLAMPVMEKKRAGESQPQRGGR